jgi:hypothetical protein
MENDTYPPVIKRGLPLATERDWKCTTVSSQFSDEVNPADSVMGGFGHQKVGKIGFHRPKI